MLFRSAGFAWHKKPGRREYLRASLERKDGRAVARRYPKDGAGIISSLVQSDGFAIIGEEVAELTEGDTIDFLPFSEVFG